MGGPVQWKAPVSGREADRVGYIPPELAARRVSKVLFLNCVHSIKSDNSNGRGIACLDELWARRREAGLTLPAMMFWPALCAGLVSTRRVSTISVVIVDL